MGKKKKSEAEIKNFENKETANSSTGKATAEVIKGLERADRP